jgi:acetyl esterase
MSPQTPYLDPLNSALAAQFAAGPPIQDLSIKRFRAFFEKLQKPDHSIPGVTRTSFTVPFEAGLKTFIFKPDSAAKGDVLPVVFYFHGGGWISGTYVTCHLPKAT